MINPIEQPNNDITIRPKRQITLPVEICEALGLNVGDKLQVEVTDAGLLVKPKKNIALDALSQIQSAFSASGISEEELLAQAREIRKQFSANRYGQK